MRRSMRMRCSNGEPSVGCKPITNTSTGLYCAQPASETSTSARYEAVRDSIGKPCDVRSSGLSVPVHSEGKGRVMLNLSIPEHIEPLRNKVLQFIEERIYPVEKELFETDRDGRRETMQKLMKEAKAQGLWAL